MAWKGLVCLLGWMGAVFGSLSVDEMPLERVALRSGDGRGRVIEVSVSFLLLTYLSFHFAKLSGVL